jgi:hypothetical protein
MNGSKYKYYIKKLPAKFDANQIGNYVFTKLVKNKWVPISIGEGDLRDVVNDDHNQMIYIRDNGATHIHVHLNPGLADRIKEEIDLLANYKTP